MEGLTVEDILDVRDDGRVRLCSSEMRKWLNTEKDIDAEWLTSLRNDIGTVAASKANQLAEIQATTLSEILSIGIRYYEDRPLPSTGRDVFALFWWMMYGFENTEGLVSLEDDAIHTDSLQIGSITSFQAGKHQHLRIVKPSTGRPKSKVQQRFEERIREIGAGKSPKEIRKRMKMPQSTFNTKWRTYKACENRKEKRKRYED